MSKNISRNRSLNLRFFFSVYLKLGRFSRYIRLTRCLQRKLNEPIKMRCTRDPAIDKIRPKIATHVRQIVNGSLAFTYANRFGSITRHLNCIYNVVKHETE